MLVITNRPLVQRQVGKANWALLITMVALVSGAIVSCVLPAEPTANAISSATLIIAFLAFLVSNYYSRRYAPRFRLDEPLTRALKGLDNRYTLLNFASPRLPDYLLLGPHGVRVLVPRAVGGTIRCQRDRWVRVETPRLIAFLSDPVRNPTAEAEHSVRQLQRYLERALGAEEAGSVPLNATIVFTDPKVRLEIEGCKYPVTRAKDLRAHILRDRGNVTPAQVARLRQVLAPPGLATAQ